MFKIVEDNEYVYVHVRGFLIQIKDETDAVVVDIFNESTEEHLAGTYAYNSDLTE